MAKVVQFKAGDIVQLKAGGPRMVVETWQTHTETYKCTWFAGAKHNSENFKQEALRNYIEEDK